MTAEVDLVEMLRTFTVCSIAQAVTLGDSVEAEVEAITVVATGENGLAQTSGRSSSRRHGLRSTSTVLAKQSGSLRQFPVPGFGRHCVQRHG